MQQALSVSPLAEAAAYAAAKALVQAECMLDDDSLVTGETRQPFRVPETEDLLLMTNAVQYFSDQSASTSRLWTDCMIFTVGSWDPDHPPNRTAPPSTCRLPNFFTPLTSGKHETLPDFGEEVPYLWLQLLDGGPQEGDG
jgi:hypothetical protein